MLTLILRWILVRENEARDKRKERGEAVGKVGVREMEAEARRENWEFLDLTDRENGEFRYSL